MNDEKRHYAVWTDPYSDTSCFVDSDMSYCKSATVPRTILNVGATSIARFFIKDQAGYSSKGDMKRCGYIKRKDIVPFEEALQQIEAAVAACDKYETLMGTDGLLILVQKDARGSKTFA